MPKSFDDDPAEDNNVTPDSSFGPSAQPEFVVFRSKRNRDDNAWSSQRANTSNSTVRPTPVPAQQVDTSSFTDATIDPELAKEPWMKSYWRPAMGWLYLSVCACDFIIFPIMWTVVQFWEKDIANDAFRQWEPLTLQGAGLFHMAMGAVLGIAAWGRTKEKSVGKN